MLTQKSILEQIMKTKPEIESLGIRVLGLFGSYARGGATELSDIDILIETTPQFVQQTDPLHAFSVLQEVRDRYQQMFQTTVDIADKNALSDIGKEHILGTVIYV